MRKNTFYKEEKEYSITIALIALLLSWYGFLNLFINGNIIWILVGICLIITSVRFAIGVDYVPQGLESETAENVRHQKSGLQGVTATTNKVQVDFEDLTTLYVALNVTENFYIKAGLVTVDVITKESLGTGSQYGNGDLDGQMYGVGYHTEFGNGMFARIEGTVMDLGGQKLTSTTNADNTVELKDVVGATGRISIGKSF